jgi:hypothetical protein
LSSLGYNPVLSSSEGFADYSPELQPWESCLQVLDTCPIMVLVIDGKYGSRLDWPMYKDEIKEKASPTHAEYLHAHARHKRMLVFVREQLMGHYESYRRVLKDSSNDAEATRKALEPTLPKFVEYDVLPFLAEVKTTRPVPWISTFRDVTEIKSELQKKLLNQLAEVFLLKEKHMEVVVRHFGEVIDALPEEQRVQVLKGIGATRQLMEEIAVRSRELADARAELRTVDEGRAKDQAEKEALVEQKKSLQLRIEQLSMLNAVSVATSGPQTFSGSSGISGFLSGSGDPRFFNPGPLTTYKPQNLGYVGIGQPGRCTSCGAASLLPCNTCGKAFCSVHYLAHGCKTPPASSQ